ncbi:hypothetical protein CEXT_133881 [Caerostris extrusa]|uniref:Uncharacterized protein n=1 Tax=Caerostris extrusa TaxID=172846 RepID=A0AAV4XKB3_CAEEX|nr:hypothetical protein CEXT_133881 [Caerostris extrusa]
MKSKTPGEKKAIFRQKVVPRDENISEAGSRNHVREPTLPSSACQPQQKAFVTCTTSATEPIRACQRNFCSVITKHAV